MTNDILFIGTGYAVGEVFNENGDAMTTQPCLCLHQEDGNKYYVADSYEQTAAGYLVGFSAAVTERMTPGVYNLECYEDSSMNNMLEFDRRRVVAMVVSASPEQINDSQEV